LSFQSLSSISSSRNCDFGSVPCFEAVDGKGFETKEGGGAEEEEEEEEGDGGEIFRTGGARTMGFLTIKEGVVFTSLGFKTSGIFGTFADRETAGDARGESLSFEDVEFAKKDVGEGGSERVEFEFAIRDLFDDIESDVDDVDDADDEDEDEDRTDGDEEGEAEGEGGGIGMDPPKTIKFSGTQRRISRFILTSFTAIYFRVLEHPKGGRSMRRESQSILIEIRGFEDLLFCFFFLC